MVVVSIGDKVVIKRLRAARYKKGLTFAPYVVRTPSPWQEKVRAAFTAISQATAGLPLKVRMKEIGDALRGVRYKEERVVPLSQAEPKSLKELRPFIDEVKSRIKALHVEQRLIPAVKAKPRGQILAMIPTKPQQQQQQQ